MKTKVINHEFGQIFIFGDISESQNTPFFAGVVRIMKDDDIALINVLDDDEIYELRHHTDNMFWNMGDQECISFNIKDKTFDFKDFKQEFIGKKYTKYDFKFKMIIANLICNALYNDPIPEYIELNDKFNECKLNSKIIELTSGSHNDISFKSGATNNLYNVTLALDEKQIENSWFGLTVMGEGFSASGSFVPYKGYIIFEHTIGAKSHLSINDSWDHFLFFQTMAVIIYRLKIRLELIKEDVDTTFDYICQDIFPTEENNL